MRELNKLKSNSIIIIISQEAAVGIVRLSLDERIIYSLTRVARKASRSYENRLPRRLRNVRGMKLALITAVCDVSNKRFGNIVFLSFVTFRSDSFSDGPNVRLIVVYGKIVYTLK